jgi:hypothetical protein
MHLRVRLQLAEALGPINRWFCSEAFAYEVEEEELLVAYYIKSGGAADFARRWDHAMGMLNRWYCSEYYRREIRDPEILWDYYINHSPTANISRDSRRHVEHTPAQLHIAC